MFLIASSIADSSSSRKVTDSAFQVVFQQFSDFPVAVPTHSGSDGRLSSPIACAYAFCTVVRIADRIYKFHFFASFVQEIYIASRFRSTTCQKIRSIFPWRHHSTCANYVWRTTLSVSQTIPVLVQVDLPPPGCHLGC